MEIIEKKELNNKYELMDILKFICAIFVIGIHSNIMGNPDSNIQWYIVHVIFRISVPFFFICSGFLFGRKYFTNNKNLKEICKKQLKRLYIPFIFWMIISLPYSFIVTQGDTFLIKILKLLQQALFYPWGSLWFMLALIVSIYIEYLFLKKGKLKHAIILSILLFVIGILGNSYYFILNDPLKKIMDLYLKIFISTRNGIFVGFPLFTAGVVIAKNEKLIEKISKMKIYIALVLIIIIQIGEVTFIRNKNYTDDHSLFFTTIFVASMLLILCIKYKDIRLKKIDTKLLRNLSTGIYFMQAPIIRYTLLILNIGSWGIFLITVIISITTCLILNKINNKYINYIIK